VTPELKEGKSSTELIKQNALVIACMRYPVFAVALVFTMMALLYWSMIASDRYVSEAHIVIQDAGSSSSQGTDSGGVSSDISSQILEHLMLRDYLLSMDILMKLEAKLGLREHYSDARWDLMSRMWSADSPIEDFYEYYLSRVEVEYDEYNGLLIIKAQAYHPKMAKAIVDELVRLGGERMNELAHSLAHEQVRFLEKEVIRLHKNNAKAHALVLDFQDEHGMISPSGTVDNITGIINSLETRLSDLYTERDTMLGYLMKNSPSIKNINREIAAVKKQLGSEKTRLVSAGSKTLNSTMAEHLQLQLAADFSQELYNNALLALSQGRVDAARTLKMIAVLYTPILPQSSLEPNRMYNSVATILFALILSGIIQLLVIIIRDHKD